MLVMSPFWFSAGSGTLPPLGTGICLFGAGANGSALNSIELYNCNNNTVSNTTSLPNVAGYSTSTGNYSIGLWQGDSSTTNNNVDLFTYSNQTTTAGTALNYTPVQAQASVGNATLGVISGSVGSSSYSNIYTYSSNTVTTGTALQTGRAYAVGVGNATQGYFIGGYNSADTVLASADEYNYSANTTVTVTSAQRSRYGSAVAGNTTSGVIAGGDTSYSSWAPIQYSDIFSFTSNTYTAGSSALTYAVGFLAASGNGSTGVFATGENASRVNVTTTNLYSFSGGTFSVGTSMGTARRMASATCTTPGGF